MHSLECSPLIYSLVVHANAEHGTVCSNAEHGTVCRTQLGDCRTEPLWRPEFNAQPIDQSKSSSNAVMMGYRNAHQFYEI